MEYELFKDVHEQRKPPTDKTTLMWCESVDSSLLLYEHKVGPSWSRDTRNFFICLDLSFESRQGEANSVSESKFEFDRRSKVMCLSSCWSCFPVFQCFTSQSCCISFGVVVIVGSR